MQVIIVGSGRSGTKQLEKLFNMSRKMKAKHERGGVATQAVTTLYAMGYLPHENVKLFFGMLFDRDNYIEISNKYSWAIPPIASKFPEAKFVHIIRDGRRVTSSYFHKLGDECYTERGVLRLYNYVRGLGKMPELQKENWWPFYLQTPCLERFMILTQFQRIAWHWAEIIRVIERDFKRIPNKHITMKFEDLLVDDYLLYELLDFCGCSDISVAEARRELAIPHNVTIPRSYELSYSEKYMLTNTPNFWKQMLRYGYREDGDYAVEYGT